MSVGSGNGDGVKFSSRLSTVLVAAGCSVGLGNIWRFPYVMGESGGGAFLLIYLLAIFVMGIPLMMSEFAMGRQTQRSAVGAYKILGPKWRAIGYNGVLSAMFIMGFYYVVAGWTVEYLLYSVNGTLSSLKDGDIKEYANLFNGFITDSWSPICFTVLFVVMNHLIIVSGVAKGLERVSKLLMPLLFFILIALSINSLTMSNAMEGLEFMFKPDFSKLTPLAVLNAIGQAFFSLSIGLGAMIAYGSYIHNDTSLRSTAMQVTILDTLVALISGIIIFPAIFSVGIEPTAGPALVFQTLPAIFNTLPFASLWAAIFFVLLIIAALTSTMSLHEVVTVFFIEEWGTSRPRGTLYTSIIILILGALASFSLTGVEWLQLFGLSLFDALDYVTANVMLPVGGFLTCVFIGWFMDKHLIKNQLTDFNTNRDQFYKILIFLIRYICPIVVFIILLNSLGLLGL